MKDKLTYGKSDTYSHTLDEDGLKYLVSKTNRRASQTQFLYQLVDGDFEKLKELEMKIHNNFLYYCPGNKEMVEDILKMSMKSNLLTL